MCKEMRLAQGIISEMGHLDVQRDETCARDKNGDTLTCKEIRNVIPWCVRGEKWNTYVCKRSEMEHVDAQEAAEKRNTLMSKRDDKKYALMCEQVGLNTGIWFSLTTIQIDGIPVLSWWPVNWPWPVRIDLRGIIMRCPWLYDLSWHEFTHGFGTNLTHSDEVFSHQVHIVSRWVSLWQERWLSGWQAWRKKRECITLTMQSDLCSASQLPNIGSVAIFYDVSKLQWRGVSMNLWFLWTCG